MAQRRADERMAGITAAHRFRLGEQRPGWLAKSKAFSSVMRQERNLEIIKKKSDARRAASEKENAAAPDAGGACRATYNYAFSREAHQLYYDTNARLLGAAGAPLADSAGRDISGVAHHMVLRGDVVAALEAAVAARHGAPLHAALFRGAAGVAANARRNAFSEYQLYFHFARRRFPASVRVRQLYWANGPGPRAVAACGADGWPAAALRTLGHATEAVEIDRAAGYDFAAYHSYAKRRPCVYGPAADAADGGACFGGGCTRACFKSRIDERFKRRDRAATAPRLCAAR